MQGGSVQALQWVFDGQEQPLVVEEGLLGPDEQTLEWLKHWEWLGFEGQGS